MVSLNESAKNYKELLENESSPEEIVYQNYPNEIYERHLKLIKNLTLTWKFNFVKKEAFKKAV